MGDDLSTGAKIGIGLVILCFLIAIVLALLMVVKNITNSGAGQMESGLNQMMQTTYDDYDQKVVTGTKITSAVKLFQSENMAIVVESGLCQKYNKGPRIYGMLLKGNQTVASTDPTKGVTKAHSTDYPIYEMPIASAGGTYPTNRSDLKLGGSTTETQLCMDTDTSTYWVGTPTNPVQFNMNTKPMELSGDNSYVRSNGKYMSMLIRDDSGTIIGIYFMQMTN